MTTFILGKISKSKLSQFVKSENVINLYKPYSKYLRFQGNNNSVVYKLSKKILSQWSNNSNQALLNLFRYKTPISLWWLIDHRNMFIDFEEIIKDFLFAQKIKKLRQSGETLNLLGKNKVISHFLTGKTKQKLKTLSIKHILFAAFSLSVIFIGAILRKYLYFIFRTTKVKLNCDILISYCGIFWKGKEHYLAFRELIKQLDHNTSFITTNYLDNTGLNLLKLIQQSKYDKHYIPLEYFFTVAEFCKMLKNFTKFYFHFRKNITKLSDVFIYEDCNFSEIFVPVLSKYVSLHLPFYFFYSMIFEKFLKKIKPKAFISIPEAGFYGRIFNTMAKKYNIRSFGLQHGIINFYHPTYNNSENFFHNANQYIDTNYCPRADLTFVFSEDVKKMLINQSFYSNDSVEAVGSPFYDDIYNTHIRKNKKKICETLNVGYDKKIALIVLKVFSKFYNDHDSMKILTDILEVLDQLDVNIIIKPHPRENPDLYNRIISKLENRHKFKILRNIPLGHAFKIADIVLGSHSTALIDAVMFDKSTVAYDPFDFYYLSEFFDEKAILRATNKAELKDFVYKLINNNDISTELHERQMKYKEKRRIIIDGKSNLRIFNILNKYTYDSGESL